MSTEKQLRQKLIEKLTAYILKTSYSTKSSAAAQAEAIVKHSSLTEVKTALNFDVKTELKIK